MSPLLSMRNISKRFGTVVANGGIDLDVASGRIVGLLGENGSGKSTLMRILFGMVRPDAGEILFKGAVLADHGPREAAAAGIAMIHQHLTLVENATVAENVMLGSRDTGRFLRSRAIADRIRATSAELGLDVDPDARVADLSLGRRQRVEILKAVLRGADLLILDEPTSNLAPSEVAGLLATLKRLRQGGAGVVFISHKLGEVLAVCDEVVVLRAGLVAGRSSTAGASRDDLARAMIGPLPGPPASRPHIAAASTGVRFAARGLAGAGLQPFDLDLAGGSVTGVAGVDGNGQIELVELLAGMRRADAGTLSLDGLPLTRASVADRIEAGLATMPADRGRTSLVRAMSVADNLRLRRQRRPFPAPRRLVERFDIRAAGPGIAAGRLSGGNQQKIVVAREMSRDPAVLVAHQPTSGLDPGATGFVLAQIAALRDRGAAILYVSSELDEILAIADEIAVLSRFRLIGPRPRADADARWLGATMSGADDDHHAGVPCVG